MNYIHKLENKKEQLKSEIALKEKEFSEQLKKLFNNNEEDIVGQITKKLKLITTLYEGTRLGISLFRYFRQ